MLWVLQGTPPNEAVDGGHGVRSDGGDVGKQLRTWKVGREHGSAVVVELDGGGAGEFGDDIVKAKIEQASAGKQRSVGVRHRRTDHAHRCRNIPREHEPHLARTSSMILTISISPGKQPVFKSPDVTKTELAFTLARPAIVARLKQSRANWSPEELVDIIRPIIPHFVAAGFTSIDVLDGEVSVGTLRLGDELQRVTFDVWIESEIRRTGKTPSAEMREWLARAFDGGRKSHALDMLHGLGPLSGCLVDISQAITVLMANTEQIGHIVADLVPKVDDGSSNAHGA